MNLQFLVHHLFEMQYRNEKHIAFTYPTHRPRPDIAFPVSVVGQFMKTPRVLHWEAVIRTVSELPDKDCCISPMGICVLKVCQMLIGLVLH